MCELDFLFIHISCIHGIHFANKVAKSVEFSSILQCIEQSEQSNLDNNNNNKKKYTILCLYIYHAYYAKWITGDNKYRRIKHTHTHTYASIHINCSISYVYRANHCRSNTSILLKINISYQFIGRMHDGKHYVIILLCHMLKVQHQYVFVFVKIPVF